MSDSVVEVDLVRFLRVGECDVVKLFLACFEWSSLHDAVFLVFDDEEESSVAIGSWQVEADISVCVRLNVILTPAFFADEVVQVVDTVGV